MGQQKSSKINWIYIVSSLIVLSVAILLAYYINYQYNPESAYTEEEKEPIPFKMYILFGIIVILILARVFYVISILVTDGSVFESLIKKDSFNFNPYLYIFYLLEFNINLLMIVLGSLCMFQFSQRRLSTVRLFACFFILSVSIIIGLLFYKFKTNTIELNYFFGFVLSSLATGIPIILYIFTFNNAEAVFVRSYTFKRHSSINYSKK